MVAKQQMKDNLSDTSENGAIKPNPGSPKSRLAMLKRSSAKLKTNASSNDPFRFQGNGVDFKGKFIGERDVTEARGDAMCAEAMRLAKAAVKAAGSHKQRIILNISIEGLKIKDEKSGAILYNFPVSKISFIARDTTDARAFGFIFGCSDGKYKFYGIKTAQTADHAVLSIRDMFQVVFEMKKKQFEEAKQKKEEQENHENSQREESGCRMDGGVMVGDLLDLETELENIAQGFNQLQNIPSMPEDSWPSTAAPNGVAFPVQTATDPFGNSFHSVPASNGHIGNGQPQFFQTPMQQNQSWAGFSTPQTHTNGLFNNGMAGNGLNTSPPFSGTNPFLQQPTFAMPQNGHSPFSSSMPPVSSQPFSLPPPQTMSSIPDPFDTQSAYRLINSMHANGSSPPNGATSTAIPRPTPSVLNTHGLSSTHVNGVASAPNLDSIFGGASSLKENTAPSANTNNGFADFNSTNNVTKWDESKSRVTTLEEAFSKLVDMNALVSTTPETKKNPFEHLINPPKIPLNALASGAPTTTAPPPSAMIPPRPFPVHPPQQQFVMPTSKNDPFNDDFFN